MDERTVIVTYIDFRPEPMMSWCAILRFCGFCVACIAGVVTVLAISLGCERLFGFWGAVVGLLGACILPIVTGVILTRHTEANGIRRVFELRPGDTCERVLERVLNKFQRRNLWPGKALVHFAHGMISDPSLRGWTFVATPNRGGRAAAPILTPFEPLALDDTDPAFEALRSGLRPETTDAELLRSDKACQHRHFRRQLLRWATPMVCAAALGCWLWGGASSFMLLLFLLVIALPILFAGATLIVRQVRRWRNAKRWPERVDPSKAQWLLVPGGLAMISPRIGQGRWNLHIVDRREAVLVAYAAYGQARRFVVLVADPQNTYSRQVTRIELDMLLRAWISPLHPPSPEQLSDLTSQ